MKKSIVISVIALAFSASIGVSHAKGDYNDVPTDDKQYKKCIVSSNKNYEGGNARSPIAGQTKAQAFCECVWNETPEEFSGDLAKFAESKKGKEINKICEKYSNWGG